MSFAPSTPRCPRCQTPLVAGAASCSTCGLALVAEGLYGAVSQPPTVYASHGAQAFAPTVVSPPPPVEYASPYPGNQAPDNYPPAGIPYGSPLAQRKSHRGLWIALAVLTVVLLASGSGVAFYVVNLLSPAHFAQTLCDEYQNGDYRAFYNNSTADLQSQFGPEDPWIAAQQQYVNQHGGVVSCTITSLTQNGSTATGTAVLTYGDGSQLTVDFAEVLENGGWKQSKNVPRGS